jgi:hypothetical protein
MKIAHTQTLTPQQKTDVTLLWNQEYPAQLKLAILRDFEDYLSKLIDVSHILYTGIDDQVLGWAFKFSRNQEKWFAIILDRSIHQQGIGSTLLNLLQENETVLNGWVIDHGQYKKSSQETYGSPLGFYLKNGFTVIADDRLDTPVLSAVRIRWTAI